MAIVEMKKVSLLALKKDKQRLLKRMQHMGCVEVTLHEAQEARRDLQAEKRDQELSKRVARLDLAILRLSPYDQNKRGMLSLKPEATNEQVASALGARGEAFEVVSRLEEIERTRGELRARESRDLTLRDQLTPWAELDIPLHRLGDTKYTSFMLLTVAQKDFEGFESAAAKLPATEIQVISKAREGVNLLLVRHVSDKDAVDAILRDFSAARVQFEEIEGTVAFAIDQLNDKLKRIEEVRAALQAEVEKLAGQLPLLRLLRDVEAAERDRMGSALLCLDTKSAFFLTGWVPIEQTDALAAALKQISPECEVEFSDPADDENPPTLLRNGKAVAPFETIVKMFSTPDPRGVDPTFVMMPFWVCFFGMMVSDAGYGVVLGLLATFVWWKLKGKGIGKMAFIIVLGGLSTVIWGAIYGGWFGVTVGKPLLDPMNDAIKVLILCATVGALHLLAGIGMAAYLNIRRGKPWDALFDQGFWVILLFGLGLFLVNGTVGAVMSLTGTLGILLTAKRDKRNWLKRIMGGLGALYGVTGYLSDLLSYARLFGMGLATGVIGMVLNMLAALLMGSPIGYVFAIVLLVGGHTFNLAINALGAYVHACRLQFIEFFGKFYESGGKDFKPLCKNTRYVDLPDGDA